ncbi:hypothetical protein SUGI_0846980 [Cryptomeria japonica]|nr:hypothetical protein SUGI_0846980 [Cryptomeria japonica]
MAKKLLCVVLLIALAVAMGMSEAKPITECDLQHCSSDGDCSNYDEPGEDSSCCEIGKCGTGVGYCCYYG